MPRDANKFLPLLYTDKHRFKIEPGLSGLALINADVFVLTLNHTMPKRLYA